MHRFIAGLLIGGVALPALWPQWSRFQGFGDHDYEGLQVNIGCVRFEFHWWRVP